MDPANPAHVYVVFHGCSRRWVDGGSIDLLLVDGQRVVATDIGVFTALAGRGTSTSWSRFGSGLPNVSTKRPVADERRQDDHRGDALDAKQK